MNVVNFFGDFIMLIPKIQYLSDFLSSLSEIFPAFICANNIGSLVNSLFEVNIFNLVPVLFLFGGFNFTLSEIVSSGS